MTWQIGLVLAMLGVAIILFVSERLRVDVVALLLMAGLAVTGLVEPRRAVAGFSNPAVVTIWAIFILSGGLTRTGVAQLLGQKLLRWAGSSETRLLTLIMTASVVLSGFMNNVGVTALLLPVVMGLARKTKTAPSRLLIPLAYSSLLGGMLTLIGTPPNLLISGALADRGFPEFQLFDFLAVGAAISAAGILYMVFVGRRLLPQDEGEVEPEPTGDGEELLDLFDLDEKLFTLRLPLDSPLADRTLGESRLGSALRLNVLAVPRGDDTHLAPNLDLRLEPADRLLVAGSPHQTLDLLGNRQLVIDASPNLDMTWLVTHRVRLARVTVCAGAAMVGKTPRQLHLRAGGVNVLALHRAEPVSRRQIPRTRLQVNDVLLVQATAEALQEFRQTSGCEVEAATREDVTNIEGQLLALRLPEGSSLTRGTVGQSRLQDALGLNVLGVVRGSETVAMPPPSLPLHEEDLLLVEGDLEAVEVLQGLQSLEVEQRVPLDLEKLQSEEIALAEVILSPHTQLAGKTVQQLNFRGKFGLQVVAVRRRAQNLRSQLQRLRLRMGDSLLVYGPRERVRELTREQDFLVLTEEAQVVRRTAKAPLALAILGSMILTVLFGWLPIQLASVAGALAMVLSGCLSMEEAYRDIDWRAVFLIAGMLPLGEAMQNTGAAALVASTAVGLVGESGPLVVLGSMFLLTMLCAQVMPTAAAAVLLAPIAFDTANHLGLSPPALLMGVAMGASTSFMSPVGHPSNVLVMGPGGYSFRDYVRVGLPLTIVILIVVLVVLPLVWPLTATDGGEQAVASEPVTASEPATTSEPATANSGEHSATADEAPPQMKR